MKSKIAIAAVAATLLLGCDGTGSSIGSERQDSGSAPSAIPPDDPNAILVSIATVLGSVQSGGNAGWGEFEKLEGVSWKWARHEIADHDYSWVGNTRFGSSESSAAGTGTISLSGARTMVMAVDIDAPNVSLGADDFAGWNKAKIPTPCDINEGTYQFSVHKLESANHTPLFVGAVESWGASGQGGSELRIAYDLESLIHEGKAWTPSAPCGSFNEVPDGYNARPDDYSPYVDEEEEPATSEEVPVALFLKKDIVGPTYSVVTYLHVQAVVDEVTINSVELNRGNCSALMTVWESGAHYPSVKNVDESPRTLKFGQELRLEPVGCADSLLEARVGTNLGDYEFSFK